MTFLLCEQFAVRYTHVREQLHDTELLWQFIRWYPSYIRCQQAVRDTRRLQSVRFLFIATAVRRYVNFGDSPAPPSSHSSVPPSVSNTCLEYVKKGITAEPTF